MILTDMHNHSHFSGDCKIPLIDMVTKGRSLGLKYMAITEHHDIDFPECGIDFTLDIEQYLEAIIPLSKSFDHNFNLLVGIELGMEPHLHDKLNTIATAHPFDFIVGSCHLAGGIDPYQKEYFEHRSRDVGYQVYFEDILKNVSSFDGFDTLGHLDYVIRYWRGDHHRTYNYKDFGDILDAILKTLIRRDKALEVNTAGYVHKLNQPNPAYDVLSRYHELGGELLTIGSDAHRTENIMSSFDVVEEKLKAIGFKSYTTYQNRQPIQIGF